VSQPTIGQIHALVALSVITGVPLVTQGQLGQVHILTAQDVIGGVPTVSIPELYKRYYTQLYEMSARMNREVDSPVVMSISVDERARMSQEMSEAAVLNTSVEERAKVNREVGNPVLPLDRR